MKRPEMAMDLAMAPDDKVILLLGLCGVVGKFAKFMDDDIFLMD